ncbi:MAG: formyl transferase [Hoeflea sp.]|uniref:formyl transferase n=1 Tax=Hoeflea sp. TaxID=1940281 RepID=UPI0032EF133D
MKIIAITGDHPRHSYFVSCLQKTGFLSGWVAEKRELFIPSPPDGLSGNLSKLFVRHFELRDAAEAQFFGNSNSDITVDRMDVARADLNDERTIAFVKAHNPDIVLSYGCHKLSQKFIAGLNAKFWNTHGGLSPDYRGVTTHFWPSYFLEPQMTGMTLHETTDHIDGGAIIFQTAAELVSGDGLHQLAARTVRDYGGLLAARLTQLDPAGLPSGERQASYGKVFMSNDWRPEHLRLIYEVYEDRIVDYVLENKLEGRNPNLIQTI